MKCPECEGDTDIIYTDPISDGEVWNRRECVLCDTQFGTVELTNAEYKSRVFLAFLMNEKQEGKL